MLKAKENKEIENSKEEMEKEYSISVENLKNLFLELENKTFPSAREFSLYFEDKKREQVGNFRGKFIDFEYLIYKTPKKSSIDITEFQKYLKEKFSYDIWAKEYELQTAIYEKHHQFEKEEKLKKLDAAKEPFKHLIGQEVLTTSYISMDGIFLEESSPEFEDIDSRAMFPLMDYFSPFRSRNFFPPETKGKVISIYAERSRDRNSSDEIKAFVNVFFPIENYGTVITIHPSKLKRLDGTPLTK